MIDIISQTVNGRVFTCPFCNMIHVEYKNLNFNFEDKTECEHFAKYFLRLDGEHWEKQNAESCFSRKIIVPIGHKNFHMILNNEELLELKELFSVLFEKPKKRQTAVEIHKDDKSILQQIDYTSPCCQN